MVLARISHSKCFWMMNEIPLWRSKNKKHRNNIQYHSFLDTLLIAWIRNLILICVIHEVNIMFVECCRMPGCFSFQYFSVIFAILSLWFIHVLGIGILIQFLFMYKCDFKKIVDFGFVGGFPITKYFVFIVHRNWVDSEPALVILVICFGFHFIWSIWASQMNF